MGGSLKNGALGEGMTVATRFDDLLPYIDKIVEAINENLRKGHVLFKEF